MGNRVGTKTKGECYWKSSLIKIIVYVCKELPSCLDTYNSGTRGMYDQYRSSILNWFQDVILNCIRFVKRNECLFANHQHSLIQGFTWKLAEVLTWDSISLMKIKGIIR